MDNLKTTKRKQTKDQSGIELRIDQMRIRRLDARNLVIERLSQPKKPDASPEWAIWGYYGKIEDLAPALLNLLLDIPQADNLAEQVRLLIEKIDQTHRSTLGQLKSCHDAITIESGANNGHSQVG